MSFHADELAAQARAGVGASSAAIRDFMPEPHRVFFAALPHLFVATPDAAGWPLATVLEGDPGFVSSPEPTALRIHSLPGPDDPAFGTIREGREIGVLGSTSRPGGAIASMAWCPQATPPASRSPCGRASATARSTFSVASCLARSPPGLRLAVSNLWTMMLAQ